MEGPLPLELQQIRADTQREAAAAAAAEAAQRRKSEDTRHPGGAGGDICIKLRRSSTGDMIQVDINYYKRENEYLRHLEQFITLSSFTDVLFI